MKKIYNIDILRFIAAISVVALHINSTVYSESNEVCGIVCESFMYGTRFAVPLFFLISGYLLYKSRNQKKNLKKTIIEFLYIIVISVFLIGFLNQIGIDISGGIIPPSGSLVPLWFFFVLIANKTIIIYCSKKISYLLSIFGFLIILINFGDVSRSIITTYWIFYFGYFISQFEFKKNNLLAIFLFSISLFILIGNVLVLHKGQYSILMSIAAVLLLLTALLFKEIKIKYQLGIYSINIYYFHRIILDSIRDVISYEAAIAEILILIVIVVAIIIFTNIYGEVSYYKSIFYKKESIKSNDISMN